MSIFFVTCLGCDCDRCGTISKKTGLGAISVSVSPGSYGVGISGVIKIIPPYENQSVICGTINPCPEDPPPSELSCCSYSSSDCGLSMSKSIIYPDYVMPTTNVSSASIETTRLNDCVCQLRLTSSWDFTSAEGSQVASVAGELIIPWPNFTDQESAREYLFANRVIQRTGFSSNIDNPEPFPINDEVIMTIS